MNWGSALGFFGMRRETLTPSSTALGPNTYLTASDFFKMLAVALFIHIAFFVIEALIPNDEVTNIPVRALSFKLGDGNRIAAYKPPAPVAAPAMTAAAPIAPPTMQATTNESWRAAPAVPSPITPAPLKPIPKPEPVAKPAPVKQPKVYKVEDPAPSQYQPVAPPAIAPTPQQYVREVGAAPAVGAADGAIGGQGAITTVNEATVQAIRARYEQQISAWIQRHKFYPAEAGGRQGRAVVRLRFDRAGNVRYYAIEQSSGLTILDAAALDMIRRANPMPAVPMDYPAGNLVEFLIPINFTPPV